MPTPITPDVTDLLGLRYRYGGLDPATGVDCLWTVRCALERIFPDLEAHEVPCTPEEEELAIKRADSGAHRWRRIGSGASAATRLGDVAHGRCAGRSFVAVLVDEGKAALLTATPKTGVRIIARDKLEHVTAVYRRRRS